MDTDEIGNIVICILYCVVRTLVLYVQVFLRYYRVLVPTEGQLKNGVKDMHAPPCVQDLGKNGRLNIELIRIQSIYNIFTSI